MVFGRNKGDHKNLLVVIIALLIILILVVVFANYDLPKNIFGGSEIEVSGKLLFDKEVLSSLNYLYGSLSNEFSGCLYGSIDGNMTRINGFKETRIVKRSEGDILFEQCPAQGDFLGTIHSHPKPREFSLVASCGMSRTDVFTFAQSKEKMSCIMCGIEKIRCYTRNDLDMGLKADRVI